MIHSTQFLGRQDERVSKKDVLVVGGGESAADIVYQISSVANTSAIAIRNIPGHIVWAFNAMKLPSDLDTYVSNSFLGSLSYHRCCAFLSEKLRF